MSNSGLIARKWNDATGWPACRRSRSISSVAISGPCTIRPGIALGFGDIAPVVMDAMTVERQRRVTKQQRIAGLDVSLPDTIRAHRTRHRRRLIQLRIVAVDDVMLLNKARPFGPDTSCLTSTKQARRCVPASP